MLLDTTNNRMPGNARMLRGINRTTILNIIREKAPISRADIARLTGLNKSTVSSVIAELIAEDLVSESAAVDQAMGRTPINLSLKLEKYFVGAINIDTSETRFAIADISGHLIKTAEIPTRPENPEEFIKNCVDQLMALKNALGIPELVGVGVSTVGIVDSRNQIMQFSPNLGWENVNVGKIIKEYAPNIKSVALGNDAKCAALAELWFGNHEINSENFVYLSLATGIGAGIVVSNRLLDGEHQSAGEFGHVVLYEGGEQCTCGSRGCWEAYASDRAIIKQYLFQKSVHTGQNFNITIQDIIDLVTRGDEYSVSIVKQVGRYLGMGISSIIKGIDPSTIIVGGRITQIWDLIEPEIAKVIDERAYFGMHKDIKILPTSLTAPPFLLGAATLAIQEIFDGYKITG